MGNKEILHLYWRAGFGLQPKQLQELAIKNKQEIIDDLFEKSKPIIPLEKDLSYLKNYPKSILKDNREKRIELARKNADETKKLNIIWLKRLAKTDNILRERMTLFWANHFVCRDMATKFILKYNNVLRTHALGNFRDFLKAITREASMIKYLNLNLNKKDNPNENFARELLELFTLGEGNYTEDDIKECSRAFTGYNHNFEGEFILRRFQHDYGHKSFFGEEGNFNGDDVIDIILKQKQCARHICKKIYRYFINEKINESYLEELVSVFYKNYEIEELMRYIFSTDWFYGKENIGVKIKSPVELIIGIQRLIPVYFTKDEELLRLQRLLDQYLLDPPNVAGWKGGKDWITSNSLVLRIKLPSMMLEEESYSYKTKGNFRNFRIVPVKNKYQQKLSVYVDWKVYKKRMKKLTLSELKSALILCEINDGTKRYISKFGRRPSKKNLVNLMSLPEYQMC
ncbi:MAG: DUF1800 domain-containing protein [Winogradskyella sp.]|uniref:DUF1800 domain-containing protein n=1 Tax=Winogradskyella sp. TaxID=1883156 RepID=UPI000F3E236F|nr:DUF1800 domain-containing protein [Winogradskyella sp.]RNC87979.1 MAG: DUF1800 domain-containing protein [Winogradskyella sp.]